MRNQAERTRLGWTRSRLSTAVFLTAWLVVAGFGLAQPNSGPQSTIHLTDATDEAGLDFRHFNGMSGELYYPEVVGAGGALFDYDRDGDLDLYLVQGAMLGPKPSSRAVFPWPEAHPLRDQLFRNDTENGELRFQEVTGTSGIQSTGYGMGAAVGDIDNDGWPDLLVLNWGANELWRNRGDGTFEDVTVRWNAGDPRFSVSASFSDFDRDGHLDLYVVNYLEYDLATNKSCLTERGERDYCLPSAYRPQPDLLLMQQEGRFVDVSVTAGLGAAANGLGVLSADFNDDGRLDIYVANDLMANHLLLQQASPEGVRFVDDALLYGAALNAAGRPEASMGVDAGDLNGDGDLDLFLTHFRRESNTLYRMDGNGFFEDASDAVGVAAPSWPHTAFGTRFVDLDLDGDLDLFIANGGVTFPPGTDRSQNPYPLGEVNQVLRNDGGRYIDITSTLGPDIAGSSGVSRSVLSGDLDNDGDVDLVVTNNSGRPQILRNDAPPGPHTAWVGLDLRLGSERGGRSALGATLDFPTSGAQPRRVRVHNDGGYASASDARVIRRRLDGRDDLQFTVHWPGGTEEHFAVAWANAYVEITEGNGTQHSGPPTDGQAEDGAPSGAGPP